MAAGERRLARGRTMVASVRNARRALQPTAAADALPTRRVSYADLDISKPAGAKTLYHRIDAAARQVCEPTGKGIGAAEQNRACIKQAIDLAVRRVDSAALSELHAATVIHLASN